MTSLNFEDFKDCDTFYYLEDLSDPGTRGAERTATISQGHYVIVFDNSDCGDTAPPWNGEDDHAGVTYTVKIFL